VNPASALRRPSARLRLGAILVLLAAAAQVALVSGPAEAAGTCVAAAATSTPSISVDDCSSALSADQILALINQTDAAAAGNLMASSDIFFANDEWLGWIDTHSSPGILRGLWPLDGAGFAATVATTDGAKRSLVYPYSGYQRADETLGYRGLHVEIWNRPEGQGGQYWTYRQTGIGQNGSVSEPVVATSTSIERRYSSTLVNRVTGSTAYESASGAVGGELTWVVSYTLTPEVFHIGTTLGATQPVTVGGDAGGLLLLINPVCRRAVEADGYYGGCSSTEVAATGLHYAATAQMGTELCMEAACTTPITTDRMFPPDGVDPRTTALSTAAGSSYQLIGDRGYYYSGARGDLRTKLVYHFNWMPDRTVMSGFGSWDLAISGNATPIALGPDYLQFGIDLRH
jgi:hypothetical protein